MKKKKYIKLSISFIVAAIGLYYVFKFVNITEILDQLHKIKIWALLLSIVIGLMGVAIRAFRWSIILKDYDNIKGINLMAPTFIGVMANLMPARLGEVYRAYLVSDTENISIFTSFSSIVIERVIDVCFLLLLFSIMLFIPGTVIDKQITVMGKTFELVNLFQKFGIMTSIMLLGIIIVIIIISFKPDFIKKIIELLLKKLPGIKNKIIELLDEVISGINMIRDFKSILKVLGMSIIVWTFFYLNYFFFSLSYGLSGYIFSGYIILIYVGLFITIFPTPGFLGSFQLGCFTALHFVLGVNEDIAAGYGMVMWAVQFVPLILVGILFIIQNNLSIMEVKVGKD